MKLKLYFCNMNNFGDALNKYIFKYIFKTDVEYCKVQKADIIGVGSILDNIYMRNCDIFPSLFSNFSNLSNRKEKLVIFSSGFGSDSEHYLSKRRYIKPLKINPIIEKAGIDVIALRGKYSKMQLQKVLSKPIDDVILGDGGLLANELINKDKIKPKYSLGIVPHYDDFQDGIFSKLQSKIKDSIIINPQIDPIEFLEQIAQCKTVVSTGMHPLIACDSLSIPNLWIRISEKTTTRYKYKDYYSVYDLDIAPLPLYNNFDKISPEYIQEQYKIPLDKTDKIRQDLKECFKSYYNL